MFTQDQADKCTILRATVGSKCLGLDTPESDTDEIGICVEPLSEAMGLDAPFEQFVRTGADETREGPDLQIYGLRKFLRLALSGNPTILALLFIPREMCSVLESRASQLRDMRGAIISKQAGKAFLGYMQAQRQRLLGERGQKRIKRPELEEKYGFDTKYAMHILRLGLQGVELLKTGSLTFPMSGPERDYLRGVRAGAESFNNVLTRAGELEAELKELLDTSPLPERPNRFMVEEWMLTIYIRAWSAARTTKDIAEDAALFAVRR